MSYHNLRAPYVPSGNPDTTHYSPPYAAGEIGASYEANKRSYQIVILDPALIPTSPTGPALANQPVYWKSKATYTITNSRTAALFGKGENEVAGILRCNPLPGEVVHVLQAGENIPVDFQGSGATAGDAAVISKTSPTSKVEHVASGTPPPTQSLGQITGAAVAGVVNINVDIDPIP